MVSDELYQLADVTDDKIVDKNAQRLSAARNPSNTARPLLCNIDPSTKVCQSARFTQDLSLQSLLLINETDGRTSAKSFNRLLR